VNFESIDAKKSLDINLDEHTFQQNFYLHRPQCLVQKDVLLITFMRIFATKASLDYANHRKAREVKLASEDFRVWIRLDLRLRFLLLVVRRGQAG